jgi:hypothetical protein
MASCWASLLALQAPAQAVSVPFGGAKAYVPIDTPVDELKTSRFLWMGESVAAGSVVMLVSLSEQHAYVYRNGVLRTPDATGVFTVLQKAAVNRGPTEMM